MIDVVARSELLEDEPLDTLGRPELGRVARLLSPTSQELDQLATLADRQLRWTSGTRLAPKGGLPPRLGPLQPLADSSSADVELAGDVRLGDALPVQPKRLKATVFEGDGVSSLSHGETIPCASAIVK